MKIRFRPSRKAREKTPENIILAGLQQAYNMHPARMMPGTIIRLLNDAGFVVVSEADLDAEIALAFQAGEESGRAQ